MKTNIDGFWSPPGYLVLLLPDGIEMLPMTKTELMEQHCEKKEPLIPPLGKADAAAYAFYRIFKRHGCELPQQVGSESYVATLAKSLQPSWWGELDICSQVYVLCLMPQYIDMCDTSRFSGADWSELIAAQPQFADRCPWGELDGYAWATLLEKRPQFIDKCPLESLDYFWGIVLSAQPQLAAFCPWNRLPGCSFVSILFVRPEFADKCRWDEISGRGWATLLTAQPQFASLCPWEKLLSDDWRTLLVEQPQFADKCDWLKVFNDDYEAIMTHQPGLRNCKSAVESRKYMSTIRKL